MAGRWDRYIAPSGTIPYRPSIQGFSFIHGVKFLKASCKQRTGSIENNFPILINPFSTTRDYKRHQNKVKVKGLGRNSLYLAGVSIFSHTSIKKFNQLA